MQSKHRWHNHLKHDLFLLVLVLSLFGVAMFTEAQVEVAAQALVEKAITGYLPTPLNQVWSYASNPTGAATNQVLGFAQQISPEAVQAAQTINDPTGAAKSQLQGEVLKQLSPDQRLVVSNIQEYGTYAQIAVRPNPDVAPDQQLGEVKCDIETNDCSIKNPDGSDFAEIPKGILLSQEQGGVLVLENSGGTDKPLKVGDFEVSNIPKGGKIKFVQSETGAEILDVQGDIKIGGREFTEISGGNFKISKDSEGKLNQVEFAEFSADHPNKFEFSYTFENGKTEDFEFTTSQDDSKVVFDPANGFAEVENIVYADDEASFESEKARFGFEQGEVSKIELAANTEYFNDQRNVLVKGDEPYTIYLDREIPVTETGNAFSFQESDSQYLYGSRGSIEYKVRDTNVRGSGETIFTTDKVGVKEIAQADLTVINGQFELEKGNLKFAVDENGFLAVDAGSLEPSGLERPNTDQLKIHTNGPKTVTATKEGILTDGENMLVNGPELAKTDLSGCACTADSCFIASR